MTELAPQTLPERLELPRRGRTAAFFLLLALFFLGPLLWGGHIAVGGDTTNQLIPMKVRQVRHGETWSEGTMGGFSLLADPQAGVFYPPNWIFSFIQESAVPSVLTILTAWHFLLAAMGAYALGRCFHGRIASVLTAMLWAFGSPLLHRLFSGISVFVEALVWMPWAFCGAELLLRAGRRGGGIALLGIAVTMQLLCGAAQVAHMTLFGAGLWIVVRSLLDAPLRKSLWMPLLGYGAAVGLAVCTAIPQLLPTLQYLRLAYPRDGGDRWAFVTGDSLEARTLLTWLWPELFAPGNHERYWASGIGFFETNGYLGIGALLLGLFAIAAAIAYRRETALPIDEAAPPREPLALPMPVAMSLLLLFTVGMLLAFGKNAPIFRFAFDYIPGMDMFRAPARWGLLSLLALCVLAGGGAQSLLTAGTQPARRTLLPWALSGGVLALFFVVCAAAMPAILAGPLGLDAQQQHLLQQGLPAPLAAEAAEDLLRMGVMSAKLAASVAAFLFIGGLVLITGRFHRTTTILLMLVIMAGDLWRFWLPYNQPYPSELAIHEVPVQERYFRLKEPKLLQASFYPQSTAIQAIQTSGSGRVLHTDDVQGWQVDEFQRELLFERPVLHGLETIRGYQQLAHGSFVRDIQAAAGPFRDGERVLPFLAFPVLKDRAPLDAYNVDRIVTYEAWQSEESLRALGLTPLGVPINEAGLKLWRNEHARGFAWVSSSEDWISAKPMDGSSVQIRARGGPEEAYQVRVPAGGGVFHVSTAEHPMWEWRNLPAGARALNSRSVVLPAGVSEIERRYTQRFFGTGQQRGPGMICFVASLSALSALVILLLRFLARVNSPRRPA